MLFLSKSPGYKFCAVKPTYKEEGGIPYLSSHGYTVEFQHTRTLEPWEEDIARSTFSFTGAHTLADEMTVVDPVRSRVSVFDTEWAPEEYRAHIEKVMLADSLHGKDYVMVERPKLPAPWPGYDSLVTAQGKTKQWVASEIARIAEEIGVGYEDAIEYERANLGRPEVLEALTELGVEKVEPFVEVTA